VFEEERLINQKKEKGEHFIALIKFKTPELSAINYEYFCQTNLIIRKLWIPNLNPIEIICYYLKGKLKSPVVDN